MSYFNVLLEKRLISHCLLLTAAWCSIICQEPGPENNKGTSFLQTRPVGMHLAINNHLSLQHAYTKKVKGLAFGSHHFFLDH